MKNIIEVQFTGVKELLKLAQSTPLLLTKNVKAGMYKTVLLGIARIANDCPIDTGRARASVIGEFETEAGVDNPGSDKAAMLEGKAQSATYVNGFEGSIGSNVEYIIYLEYGRNKGSQKKLTPKQLRYLFATGYLKLDAKGNPTASNVHLRINRRAGIGPGRVKGVGMFRKNIPVIERYFNYMMNEAIKATSQGQELV